ncbi:MAG: hypothetical protein ACK2TZ_11285 [Anaerolineales bacterium]
MKIKSVLVLSLKVIVLTMVMFVLWTIGTSIFSADSALAQQMSPEEAAAAGMMLIVVSFIDTLILTYFILRSRLRGLRLMVTVSLVLYGVKTFLSIIEAWWFMTDVNAGEMPGLFLMTVPMAVLFPVIAVWMLGKAKKGEEVDETPNTRLVMPTGQLVWKVAFLSVIVYPALFWTFGYYVAFSNPELVAYYGSTHPGSFLAQMGNVWADDPFVFLFEIFRGLLWVALAVPVIRTTKGRVWETGLILGLLFALVQNDVHLIPGVMPPSVRLSHFIETASSNFIFALIATWLLHRKHSSLRDLFSFKRGIPEID